MRRKPVLLALALLSSMLMAPCGAAEPPKSGEQPAPADDVAVFTAVLQHACDHPRDTHHTDVVLDVPGALSADRTSGWQWQPPAEFVSALVQRSTANVRWPKLTPCATQRVVEGAKVDALLAQDGTVPPSYKYFYEAFPTAGHTVTISVPAYLKDGRRAVVYRVSNREGLSSAGEILELERLDGRWRVSKTHPAWVSSF